MEKGDVLLLHSRTATAIAPNMLEEATLLVQFPLQVIDMNAVVDAFASKDAPFSGFDGLSGLL